MWQVLTLAMWFLDDHSTWQIVFSRLAGHSEKETIFHQDPSTSFETLAATKNPQPCAHVQEMSIRARRSVDLRQTGSAGRAW
jgi:hypothetical protein